MIGSWTKKFMLSVLCLRNGSSRAVAGSGNSAMSDSLIAWKPRTDEPSNAMPSVDEVLVEDGAGTVRCCITPGRSQNRMSTYSTFSSEMYLRTSSELLNTLTGSFDWIVVRATLWRRVARTSLVSFAEVNGLGCQPAMLRTT